MSRYIDADALIEEFEWLKEQSSEWRRVEIDEIIERINNQPTTDAVPKGLFDQIKWERDVAIGQLQEIGCELGQKMDDVKSVLLRRWEWLGTYSHNSEGWVGTCPACEKLMRLFEKNFCPNCGAKMDMEEE